MGNTLKREAVEVFITSGEIPVFPEGAGEVEDAPDGPLDAAWLADILERRRRLHTNPRYELPRYREFFADAELTVEEVDHLLETMEIAVARPEDFYDSLVQPEGVIGGIKAGASCAYKIPKYFPTRAPSAAQLQQLQVLAQHYPVVDGVHINPNDHQFEFCDPRWWPLLLEKIEEAMQRWPKGLVSFREHSAYKGDFVYDATKPTSKVALFSDFGVGQYHATCIAKQLTAKAYPYIFHLGDVYYGGTQKEFETRFTNVLEPVMAQSTLFCLPENHELYAEGRPYMAFLDAQRANGRMMQEGSYFCVRFPKHQLIGLDVNWNGRQRFRDAKCRQWLTDRLREGEKNKLTTILLTGSAPYCYGETGTTKLYDDLLQWSEQGHFAMWFWGDNHYAALFERSDRANYVGSCIGHGGYPGGVRKPDERSFAKPIWVETEPRFPRGAEYSELRHDLGNNGWCEFEMLDDGGVRVTYVDWLGAKRFTARFGWEQALIPRFKLLEKREYDRSELH